MLSLLKLYLPPRDSFIGGVIALMGGSSLAQLISLVSAPVIMRIYLPADYGIFSVYCSILSILIAIGSLNYDWAIPLTENETITYQVIGLCMAILILVSLLAGMLIWVAHDPLVQYFKIERLRNYLWLLPISLLGAGSYRVMSQWAIRKKAYQPIAKTKVGQCLVRALVQIGLGLLNLRPSGLIVGDLLGRVSGTRLLALMAWRQDGNFFKKISIPGILRSAKRYYRFPLFYSGSVLCSSLSLALPVFFLSNLYGPSSAGFYSFGQTIIMVPLTFISQSVSQVFFAEGSALVHKDNQKIRNLFSKLVKNLSIGSLLVAVVCLLSPLVIPYIFGEAWLEAGFYAQAMTLVFVTQFVGSPAILIFNIFELPHWLFLWDLFRLILIVSTFIIAKALNLLPMISLFLYSISVSIAYLIGILLCYYVIKIFERYEAIKI
jgi:O-antigen/teichoic acid export membrane protein